jgi:hypothetical protein
MFRRAVESTLPIWLHADGSECQSELSPEFKMAMQSRESVSNIPVGRSASLGVLGRPEDFGPRGKVDTLPRLGLKLQLSLELNACVDQPEGRPRMY